MSQEYDTFETIAIPFIVAMSVVFVILASNWVASL